MLDVGFHWDSWMGVASAFSPIGFPHAGLSRLSAFPLAQVNVGFGLVNILAIALVLAGTGLYFLRNFRPGLARDQDVFFAAIGLLCGGILFFQGWRLDPILQFAQLLSASSAVWFAYEAIRLRSVTTEQAKRSTPVVDQERPVSRVYRAELDEPTRFEETRNTRRSIRGGQDYRDGEYRDDYRDEVRENPRDEYRAARREPQRLTGERSPRRPRSSARPLPPDRSDWDDNSYNNYNSNSYSDSNYTDSNYTSSSLRSEFDASPPRSEFDADDGARPRRRSRRRTGEDSADYVDYQPIDYPDV